MPELQLSWEKGISATRCPAFIQRGANVIHKGQGPKEIDQECGSPGSRREPARGQEKLSHWTSVCGHISARLARYSCSIALEDYQTLALLHTSRSWQQGCGVSAVG